MVKPVEINGKGKSWRFSKKYYSLLFGSMMCLIMSLLTTLAVAMINIGIVENFFQMWFGTFLTTFAIGFPMAMVVTPFVKNIADKIT